MAAIELESLIAPIRAERKRHYVHYDGSIYDLAFTMEAFRDWYVVQTGMNAFVVGTPNTSRFWLTFNALRRIMTDEEYDIQNLIYDPLSDMFVEPSFFFTYYGVEVDTDELFEGWEAIDPYNDDSSLGTFTTAAVTPSLESIYSEENGLDGDLEEELIENAHALLQLSGNKRSNDSLYLADDEKDSFDGY